jgi:dihydrofolate reductase
MSENGAGESPEGGASHGKKVVLVAAVADNGVIGRDGDIPWSLPEDLKHFRRTTKGHTVVMGRATFESIGHPLPYRSNVVLTRQPGWSAEGVFVAGSVAEAIRLAQDFDGDVMVIGGGHVYAEALPLADEQVLTEVHQRPEGDTYYPEFDRSAWREERREAHEGFDFVWLRRQPRRVDETAAQRTR